MDWRLDLLVENLEGFGTKMKVTLTIAPYYLPLRYCMYTLISN